MSRIYKGLYNILNKYKNQGLAGTASSIFISDIVRKKNFVNYKLQYLNQFIKLKNLSLKKV